MAVVKAENQMDGDFLGVSAVRHRKQYSTAQHIFSKTDDFKFNPLINRLIRCPLGRKRSNTSEYSLVQESEKLNKAYLIRL